MRERSAQKSQGDGRRSKNLIIAVGFSSQPVIIYAVALLSDKRDPGQNEVTKVIESALFGQALEYGV